MRGQRKSLFYPIQLGFGFKRFARADGAAVKRIVANVATANFEDVRRFYQEFLDLDIVMDFGWIATLSSGASASVQISIASQEGGSDTTKPDLSIEVDDVDQIYQRA